MRITFVTLVFEGGGVWEMRGGTMYWYWPVGLSKVGTDWDRILGMEAGGRWAEGCEGTGAG